MPDRRPGSLDVFFRASQTFFGRFIFSVKLWGSPCTRVNPLRRICRFACGRNMSGVSGVKDATLLWCVQGDLEGGSFRLRKFGTDGRLPFLGRWHFLRFHCVLLVGIEPTFFYIFLIY